MAASDGAGVKLRRSLGSRQNLRFDPFLMLDEFFSDDPDDYLAGFPAHPHRGFETVTYMLDGHMRHEDSFGNRGDLGPGDVQWMTAAHGIIHSEMPQQTEGRMRGFQLWINLPAREKMKPAAYRDIPSREIPTVALDGGRRGSRDRGRVRARGPAHRRPDRRAQHRAAVLTTCVCPPTRCSRCRRRADHNTFLYVYEGDAVVGDDAKPLPFRAAGLLTPGDEVVAARRRAGRATAAAVGQADRRAGRAVRSVRDEHARRRSSRRSSTTSSGQLAVAS